MALIVKYKFQNVDANGDSVTLLPQFPSGVSYTKTDVVEGNITTRVIETDDLSKVTYIRFGCNENTYVVGAWEYLTEILDINISYVNTFNRMFRGCKLLNKIDVSKCDTSKVTDMSSMFAYCSKLTQLDVSNFDTSKATSMGGMFAYCYQLTQLNVSNWDTSKVTNMGSMFNSCYQLTQLDVSNWDTSKVTDMGSMFAYCHQLTQLNVSNWDTSKVINMASMFQNCSKLTQLDLSKCVASKVTNMQSMFQNCFQLTQLDVSNFDTSNVTSMAGMFAYCSKLTQLDVSNWDTSKVTNMYSMFNSCSQLTQLDVSNFDTSKVTNMQNMFSSCKVKNVGLIYCSKDTIDKLANCITSPCNFYVTNKTYTSPNPLVKYVMYREDKKRILYYNDETQTWEKPILREWDSIEKHSDGKYYYHKRSGEMVLNGSEDWTVRNDLPKDNPQGTHLVFQVQDINLPIKVRPNDPNIIVWISDIIQSLSHRNGWDNSVEGLHFASFNLPQGENNCRYFINIAKSKLSTQDVAGFKAWLQTNNVTVIYQLAEEKVYECTDLDLITYQNETNFIVNTGAITPKSTLKVHQNIVTILQEKVNVLENEIFIDGKIYKELDKVKKLEESTASTVTTESDFTTVTGTSNGYFEDVKLEGRTLVNLANAYNMVGTGSNIAEYTFDGEYYSIQKTNGYTLGIAFKSRNDLLEANKTYTIIINNKSEIQTFLYDVDYKKISNLSNGINIIKFTPSISQPIRVGDVNNNSSEGLIKFAIVLLEGDHTQNPPEFFEGLKSVGQDADEISVLSAEQNIVNYTDRYINSESSYYEFIPITSNDVYYNNISDKNIRMHIKNKTGYVKYIIIKPNSSKKYELVDGQDVYAVTLNFEYGWDEKLYDINSIFSVTKSAKQDKKRILYYNTETDTWEKPILRQWDSIEKHSDGKYYYHKRSGEVVLDGSEDWDDRSEAYVSDTQTRFSIEGSVKPCSIGAISLICDKYTVVGAIPSVTSVYKNGINHHITGSTIYVTVPKTTLANFISSLQANPVTVVYQLAEEKVYECINIDLITYENETNFIVNTGAITPKSTLKVMCNITNVVRELQQKVSNLENYIQHVMIDALNNALNE